jgi:peptide deformylase
VGVHQQLLVIDLDLENPATPPMVLINPEITAQGGSICTYEEGCLSIPGVYLDVVRPSVVEVTYRCEMGRSRRLKADGLLARCIQHEMDSSQRRAVRRSGQRWGGARGRSQGKGFDGAHVRSLL